MAAFHGGQRPCCPEGQAPRPLPSLTDTALPAEAVAPAVPLGFSPVSRPLMAPPVWQCREEVRLPPAPRQGAGGAGSFLRGRRGPHGPPSLQWACGARLPSEAFRGVSEGHMAPSTPGVAGGRGPAACWLRFPGGLLSCWRRVWVSGFGARGRLCSWGCTPQLCQVPGRLGGASVCLVRPEPESLPVGTGSPHVHALCWLLGRS